jgi:hypothetical protein
MDTITRFLKHYSYLFPKGYPDMNNLEDKALLHEILTELDVLDEVNGSPLTNEAIEVIKAKYNLDDTNFKLTSSNMFKLLIPDGFKLSRKEVIDDLQNDPDFKFDEESIGNPSSLGRLKYKNKVIIYIKFAKGQGNESAGKLSESSFLNLINNNISEEPITIILKSNNKTKKFEGITKCKDTSDKDTTKYIKADVQLLAGTEIKANISLKKRNAIRWESSKGRFGEIFNNFIKKAENRELGNIILKPIEGAKNKYKLFNSETNKKLSKVVIINAPKSFDDETIFGINNLNEPKTIVVKEDFENYNDYTFENNTLTINCYKIYTDVEDVLGTLDEPVFAFSNHIGQKYGIEFRVFNKGLLYNDSGLKGSIVEINWSDLE